LNFYFYLNYHVERHLVRRLLNIVSEAFAEM